METPDNLTLTIYYPGKNARVIYCKTLNLSYFRFTPPYTGLVFSRSQAATGAGRRGLNVR